MEDIDAVLAQNPEEETAILLRGKVKEANGQEEEAEADYKLVISSPGASLKSPRQQRACCNLMKKRRDRAWRKNWTPL